MANSISHASLPYPVKNARFTVMVPFLDADGDPTDPTTPDTEVSQDGGAFADAAEEVTTVTGSNGMGYVTLTGAEMNNSAVGVCFKVASGPKATLFVLYPRVLPILETGTAQAGAAGTITLTSGAAAYDLTGCIVRTTGGTGGGGTGGANNQARMIISYNTSTKVATVSPNWETNPSSDTTYDILYTDLSVNAVKGNNTSFGGTAGTYSSGRPEVNASHAAGTAWNSGAITTGTFASGAINAAAIASDAIGSDELAATAASEIATAVWANATRTLSALGFTLAASDLAADTITASKVAADVWTEARVAINGGDYALSTDANGRIRSVDGTGTGEIDTASGRVQITEAQIDQVVDEVWDEATTGHATSGTFGEQVKTDIDSIITTLGSAGAGLSAIPWNAAWDAEVQSEVQDAVEANHLDHIFAADYDPANKPGVATALLNELVENDAGVSRFTANALEQAPSGGGGGGDATLANQTTIIDHLTDIKGAGWTTTDTLEAIRDRGDAAWATVTAAAIRTALGLGSANLDTQLAAIQADTDAIEVDTQDIQSRLPAALVGGRMDSSVGAMAADVITGSAIATSATQELRVALNGGDWAADMDANGRQRIVDGTGTGEVALTGGAVDSVLALGASALSSINGEMVDALAVDTYAEPSQGTPPASASFATMHRWLYAAWRNKKTQTSSEFKLFADDGTTVLAKASGSDDGTTLTIGEFVTGA